eukprot:TRINITY_DN51747_c0_g1_i1.p1 TRINITY_DN51747_c0_g1~~TRINITY_DN51747_c0_g1_i1.p1  ORF type:complete len:217 (-),score=28.80 TRINITY_DN51747_c0_g1_i1:286-936(-)
MCIRDRSTAMCQSCGIPNTDPRAQQPCPLAAPQVATLRPQFTAGMPQPTMMTADDSDDDDYDGESLTLPGHERVHFRTTAAGKTLEVKQTPECFWCPFFLPFPFFCMGCCLSRTTITTWNDSTQTVSIIKYCGYCCCCAKTVTANYADLTGVGTQMSNMKINGVRAREVTLEFRAGGEVAEVEPITSGTTSWEGQVAAWRRFVKYRKRVHRIGGGK